jgi:hypothetical protein
MSVMVMEGISQHCKGSTYMSAIAGFNLAA